MGSSGSQILVIVVVNVVIGVVQALVQRQIPTIGFAGHAGVYMILLPLGFGLFEADMPYSASAPFIVLGLALVLYAMKKQLAAARKVQ
jgi:hypothetical protein